MFFDAPYMRRHGISGRYHSLDGPHGPFRRFRAQRNCKIGPPRRSEIQHVVSTHSTKASWSASKASIACKRRNMLSGRAHFISTDTWDDVLDEHNQGSHISYNCARHASVACGYIGCSSYCRSRVQAIGDSNHMHLSAYRGILWTDPVRRFFHSQTPCANMWLKNEQHLAPTIKAMRPCRAHHTANSFCKEQEQRQEANQHLTPWQGHYPPPISSDCAPDYFCVAVHHQRHT